MTAFLVRKVAKFGRMKAMSNLVPHKQEYVCSLL